MFLWDCFWNHENSQTIHKQPNEICTISDLLITCASIAFKIWPNCSHIYGMIWDLIFRKLEYTPRSEDDSGKKERWTMANVRFCLHIHNRSSACGVEVSFVCNVSDCCCVNDVWVATSTADGAITFRTGLNLNVSHLVCDEQGKNSFQKWFWIFFDLWFLIFENGIEEL